MIVVKAIPSVGLGLKYFGEVVEEALTVDERLGEGRIRLEDDMLALVALIEVL